VLLDVLALLDSIDDVDAPTKKRRSTLVLRERRPFATYIRPMLQDRTFSMRFRMGYDDFMALVDLVRPAVKRDEEMGLLRNGTIPVEYQVAMTLRWLAGGSIYECMDGHVIARSTAYCLTSRVISALNACPELNCDGRVVYPSDQTERDRDRGAEQLLQRAQEGLRHELPGEMLSSMYVFCSCHLLVFWRQMPFSLWRVEGTCGCVSPLSPPRFDEGVRICGHSCVVDWPHVMQGGTGTMFSSRT